MPRVRDRVGVRVRSRRLSSRPLVLYCTPPHTHNTKHMAAKENNQLKQHITTIREAEGRLFQGDPSEIICSKEPENCYVADGGLDELMTMQHLAVCGFL